MSIHARFWILGAAGLAVAAATGITGCAHQTHGAAWSKAEPVESPASTISRADRYYLTAKSAIDRREYSRALEALQVARANAPSDVRVMNAFGVVYDKLGRFDLAQRYYEQAEALDPKSTIVAANMAYSRRLSGEVAAAPVSLAAAATSSETGSAPAPPPAPLQPSVTFAVAPPTETAPATLVTAVRPVVAAQLEAAPHVGLLSPASPKVELARASLQIRTESAPMTSVPAAIPAKPEAETSPTQAIAQTYPKVELASLQTRTEPASVASAPAAAPPKPQPKPSRPPLLAAAVAAPPEPAPRPAHPTTRARTAPLPAKLARAAGSNLPAKPVRIASKSQTTRAPAAIAAVAKVSASNHAVILAAVGTRTSRATLQSRAPAQRTVRPPLFILDTTGQSRRAELVRVALGRRGWSTPQWALKQGPRQSTSMIYYPQDRLPDAKALSATLPGSARLVPCRCTGLKLVLGVDSAKWRRMPILASTSQGARI